MRILALAALLGVVLVPSESFGEELRIDYTRFCVWMDCDRRGAVRFRYDITEDNGNLGRLRSGDSLRPLATGAKPLAVFEVPLIAA